MQKIPTLFLRNEVNRRYVRPVVSSECVWVANGEGTATRKWDGTCVLLDDNGKWWARREVKPEREIPPNFVPVHHDPVTGKLQGWEPIEQSAFVKFHTEALDGEAGFPTEAGTYELVGPKINGNPDRFESHTLVQHGAMNVIDYLTFNRAPRTYDGLADWLHDRPQYEGIVFHHPDGRMAKIKRRDFRYEPKES